MSVTLLRGNALALPLADDSVDLIVTSPPYFGLRSYIDGGEHYAGQLGSEPTPAEFLDALIAATAEMARVLKPSGSIFCNLGDRYNSAASGMQNGHGHGSTLGGGRHDRMKGRGSTVDGIPQKSLMLIPERYRIRCVDELGLIARAVLVWSKPNGLPESTQDRVRRSHEDWVHLTKQPRYYAAIDEIREPHAGHTLRYYGPGTGTQTASATAAARRAAQGRELATRGDNYAREVNPLGKLPGSVWTIPTQPLKVPPEVGADHFAAFPMEWPRRLIRGWSPPGICLECGEGRRPVADRDLDTSERPNGYTRARGAQTLDDLGARPGGSAFGVGPSIRGRTSATITGYACACTPYTDHPGTGERHRNSGETGKSGGLSAFERQGDLASAERVGPWREYHFDQWTPAPTRPAVVLDVFGGTGTTALVADALGRHGISVDMSADYCRRIARWRTTDPGQRAAALQVEKPAPVAAAQDDLLTLLTDAATSAAPALKEATA